ALGSRDAALLVVKGRREMRMAGEPSRLAFAEIVCQRGAVEIELVALAVIDGIEQQVRLQRLVLKTAREIMGVGRLAELFAALDLDLIAIEAGIERRLEREIEGLRRREEGLERDLDLVSEFIDLKEGAAFESRRGIETPPSALFEIMRQR